MSDLPAGFVEDHPLPPGFVEASKSEGESPLKKVTEALGGAYRGFEGARTAAARDPVGALGNALGAAEGGVAGAVMNPVRENTTSLGGMLSSVGRGAVRGATNPQDRDRFNADFGDMVFGPVRPQGESMPARFGRGAEDFTLQTMIDPVTHGGAAAAGALIKGGKAAGGAMARGVKPLGNYVREVGETVNDPKLKPAISKVAHGVQTLTAPIRGGVNAGKDLLFMNPLPHGLGNMTALNFLKNGPGTTLKGLKYGITGTPKATADELQRIKAGAWTPELLDEPSPWGPVGWMSALGKKGVPAAVRGGVGAAAGGTIADKTAPDTATPQQRLLRVAEGSLLGGLTGASPEVLNASNKLMSRLETGHRGAMLEDLPKPGPAPKPRYSAKEVSAILARKQTPTLQGPAVSTTANRSARPSGLGNKNLFQHGMNTETPPDPRGDAINAVFGGGPKSGTAKIASALGGPFAQWQADVVPRNVGRALKNAPARVEAFARGQDIINRDVLKDQPYKLQTGGPIGGAAEMIFNTPKYASRLLGPLGGIDPNETTNPKTLSAEDKLKDFAYGATPGREVVGPFFGDTLYPSRAPALPSASVDALLGWHFANKTPKKDAILSIMQATGLDSTRAGRVYDRYKR